MRHGEDMSYDQKLIVDASTQELLYEIAKRKKPIKIEKGSDGVATIKLYEEYEISSVSVDRGGSVWILFPKDSLQFLRDMASMIGQDA